VGLFFAIILVAEGEKCKIFPIYAVKGIGGVWMRLHLLTLTVDGDEWSTSHPGHPTPMERTSLPVKQEA
jgi:hypothetical protein